MLQVSTDPELSPLDIRVTSFPGRTSVGETASLPALPASAPNPSTTPTIPPGAFLIVNGNRHFSLNQPVINIGRRPDNHLVINDPRVSRTHAQIRAIKGCYVLFDLNSTGGTFINSVPVNQHILSTGDVISLAGYILIYGQDADKADSETTNVIPTQLPRQTGSASRLDKP
jgi:pSer/pThr/pTyr-binding forkhead associated (FHA) protein